MMKVLLVKPPEQSRFNFGTFSLAVLAACVRDAADVSIFDATRLSAAQASEQILARKSDLIGITVMSPSSVKNTCSLIHSLRHGAKRHKKTVPPIVCGGHGASMYPLPLLTAGAESVVVGPGERPFRSMILSGLSDVPGTIRRAGKDFICQPAEKVIIPDQLPRPARDLMGAPDDHVHLMETSRGCPHRCSFCETSRFYSHTWKPFPAAGVTAEVRELVEEQNAFLILLSDDNFAVSASRVVELSDLLQRGPLPLFFMASARLDDLSGDARILPAMAAARIGRVSVGIEAIDDKPGKTVGKGYSLDLCRDVVAHMHRLGMYAVASFIVGLPGETPRMRAGMLDAALATGADSVTFVPFHPLPHGTERTCAEIRLPDAADERAARRLTKAFYRHPDVVAQRQRASAEDSLRGLIIQASFTLSGD